MSVVQRLGRVDPDAEDERIPPTPVTAGLVPDETVKWAIAVVDGMGVLDPVSGWKDENRRGPGGRPELFPLRALLVALTIAARCRRPLHAQAFHDILFIGISPAFRARLSVPDPPGQLDVRGWRANYRNVRTRLHGFLALIDPSDQPKNRLLGPEEYEAAVERMRAEQTDEERAECEERLTWICNQILESSIGHLPRRYRRRYKGSLAVDATPIPAFARKQKQKYGKKWGSDAPVERYSSDPDAYFYQRTVDSRDDLGEPIGTTKKSLWAYEASILVSGADDPSAAFQLPSLVMAMARLHKPGRQPGQNAILALQNLSGRGYPAGLLAGDRAYSSAKFGDFQLPARSLGYKLIFDYKVDQLGIQASAEGLIQVEGAWYCPSMPDVLIAATRDLRDGLVGEDVYAKRIEARKAYRARAYGRPDVEGHQRMQCPAAGDNPLARCPLKKLSMSTSKSVAVRIKPRAEVSSNPPKICIQKSVTMAPVMGAKFDQALPYGTEEWHSHYATLRNSIEGMNGYAKDGAHEALADASRRRIRGVAAQSLFVAFLLFAANLRKIDAFLAQEDAIEAGTVKRLPRQRATRSLASWRPTAPSPERPARPPPE